MGWNGSLTADSAIGASITYTPGTSSEGAYTVDSFTAPKKGVYRFVLKGSGGTVYSQFNASGIDTTRFNLPTWPKPGGTGGKTDGYLLLDKGQKVYVGAGGTCSAAFVSTVNGSNLAEISSGNLYFVAGAGGAGGAFYDNLNKTTWNCIHSEGGNGGGSTGGNSSPGGYGGTQSGAGAAGSEADNKSGISGAYGKGGASVSANSGGNLYYGAISGRGGDGYYGGGSGHVHASNKTGRGYGGGGGSGYVKTGTLTVNGKTYTSTTTQGGGAASNAIGSVQVTYYARAELPIRFDGSVVERLVYNGTEIASLVFNGTKLFFERIKRRIVAWSISTKPASRLKIPI